MTYYCYKTRRGDREIPGAEVVYCQKHWDALGSRLFAIAQTSRELIVFEFSSPSEHLCTICETDELLSNFPDLE